MKFNNHLVSAAKKISRCYKRQFGGYLTPIEILAIAEEIKIGKRAYGYNHVCRAREDVKAGISNPSWFYFEMPQNANLTKTLKKLISTNQKR